VNERRILFEASLAKTGGRLVWALLIGMVLLAGLGVYLFVTTGPFPYTAVWLLWVGTIILTLGGKIRKFLPLWRNSGVYQIAIDNYGLYVHSDVPDFAPSFSVVATNLSRLIRKTFRDSDGDDNHHEYYVETKSGCRFQIKENLMFQPRLKVMHLFDQVTDCFPTVPIVEEVQDYGSN